MISGGTVQFELVGASSGWVAVGVSADQVMGGDGIDDVFACQLNPHRGFAVYAQDMYNVQDGRANMRDSVSRCQDVKGRCNA